MNSLRKRALRILIDTKLSSTLNSLPCNFSKIPGHVYSVYQKPDSTYYISMISPEVLFYFFFLTTIFLVQLQFIAIFTYLLWKIFHSESISLSRSRLIISSRFDLQWKLNSSSPLSGKLYLYGPSVLRRILIFPNFYRVPSCVEWARETWISTDSN